MYFEVDNPLIPRKYTVLNGNSVFDLCDIFQGHVPGVKQDLPVLSGTQMFLENPGECVSSVLVASH